MTARPSLSAKRLKHPDYTLARGELIPAVLETAIHSDLPGLVRAVVERPVYSANAMKLLIPAGSKLMGHYDAGLVQGQSRVFVSWQRVLRPDGIVADLDSPGTDTLGRAGQGADHINRHAIERFQEGALLSLIGAGAANLGVGDNEQDNSKSEYREEEQNLIDRLSKISR